jgi:hypothetical protein
MTSGVHREIVQVYLNGVYLCLNKADFILSNLLYAAN